MPKYDKNRTNVYIPIKLKNKAKKQGINLSQFFTEMLERELAGEFKQLKINKLKKELQDAEDEHSHIQTQQQNQQAHAKKSYDDAEAKMLERRRQNMLQRKEGI